MRAIIEESRGVLGHRILARLGRAVPRTKAQFQKDGQV